MWEEHLHQPPPGFAGSVGGIDYALSSSGLGYAMKYDSEAIRATGQEIRFHGQSDRTSA